MRQIKFRAWHVGEKTMEYPSVMSEQNPLVMDLAGRALQLVGEVGFDKGRFYVEGFYIASQDDPLLHRTTLLMPFLSNVCEVNDFNEKLKRRADLNRMTQDDVQL